RHGGLGPQVPGSLECERASPDPLAARQADPHEISELRHGPIISTALKEAGRQDDLTQVDPFTWEHGETRPHDPGPSPGPAPAMAPVMAPDAAVDPAVAPFPGAVGMVEARPPPEPPAIPIPPPPPLPAPFLEPELPTAWAAHSSNAP